MKLPRIALYTIVMLFLCLLFVIMQTMSFYLVPVTFAALFAMLMLPVNRKLEQWHFPRILAIIISLLIILSIFGGIIAVISSEVVSFARDLPTLQQQLGNKFHNLQGSVEQTFGVTADAQMAFLKKQSDSLLNSVNELAGGVLAATGGMLAGLGFIIVHFVFFLLYRNRIKGFILMLVPKEEHEEAKYVIDRIVKVTRQYVTGVVVVMAIMSVLNSTGLLLLGIPNAIFFGVLAAILNIIPYIGVWIGTALPLFMALITKDSFLYPIGVIGVFLFDQFIDNNFLTPRITGGQVKINALATFAIIIIGNMVWGVAGMILFIPLLGMLKILFDHVEPLKPFAYLIGDVAKPVNPQLEKLEKEIAPKKQAKKS